MNPNRKVQIFHINLPLHFPYDLPGDCTELFYCFEEGDQNNAPHTHIGCVLKEPISKNKLIEWFEGNTDNSDLPPWQDEQGNTQFGLQKYQIEVTVHKHFGTVWGYHYGFGEKPACNPKPVWFTKTLEQVAIMVDDRIHHRKISSCKEQQEKTQSLLANTPWQNLAMGKVPLRGYCGFKKDWTEAKKDYEIAIEEDEEEGKEPVEIKKKRHYWFYGESNTGKTYKAERIDRKSFFNAPRNNDWTHYNNQHVVIIDEFKRGRMGIAELQELCNGSFQVNTKFGSKIIRKDIVVCITSHRSPNSIFAEEDPQDLKGIINRFNIEHLDIIYE